MTKEEAILKADELTKTLNVKVHPIVFQDNENSEPIIGFIKEPSRMVKLAVLDKSVMGGFSAAAEVLDSILIKEESDPRIYSENPEHDSIYLGAVSACYELITLNRNLLKKK
jgi:hypothetical protein